MSPRQVPLLPSEWDEVITGTGTRPPKVGPEEDFEYQCRQYGLPPVERQLRFAQAAMGRQWRFDFAWRDYWLAVEIQGVVVRRINGQLVTMGDHANVQGLRDQHDKHNTATLLGWSVLQFMPSEIRPRRAIEMTMRVLAARGWKQ
jgi:hypothetical protein